MEGLSDPKERASIRRGRAAVRPAAAAGLAPPPPAPKAGVPHACPTRNPRRRCHTHANGAIIRAARTNIVQSALDLLSNCLICRVGSLARTLQCHTTPPASHIRHLDLGGELYPFPGGDMTPSDVLKLIKEKHAKFADTRFTDTRGKEQHVSTPARLVDEDLFRDGKMFDGSSIAGWKGINESDMILMPDPSTAATHPFF